MEKTLIFSDVHLHAWRAFGLDLQSGLPKRLKEQKQVLEQILDLIGKEKIKGVIFGGDLFHKIGEIPVECLNIADWFFKELKEKKVDYWLAIGNHDVIDRSNPQWFEDASRIWNRSREVSAPFFIGNYFDSNEEIEKAKGYELVVVHKTPMYAKINEYIFEEGVNWKELVKNNRFVFFGHLHQPQKLAENCFVIGSCMQLGFGESGDRGVWIVDEKPKFYPLKSPKFITVKTYSEVQDDGNYYRVLEADKTLDKDMSNVIAVYTPKVIEERIKTDRLGDILNEWLNIKGKDKSYAEVIKDIIQIQPKKIVKSFVGKLKKVKIKNFLSIEDIEYEIPKGFTLIAGENGSGKTTLVEAIFYGLFGKTTKGLTGDDVIREGQDDCSIELELQNEQEKIRIVRQRQVLKIYANDKEVWSGVRLIDKQRLLEEEMLGFDYRMFLTSCYFSQESLLMFTSLTDSGRTELVNNLLGFDIYDSLYEKVSDRIKTYDVSIKDAEDYKNTLREKFAYTEASLKKIDDAVKQIDDFIAHKKNQINEKMEFIKKLKAYSVDIEVKDYQRDFEELNQLKEELKKRIDGLESELDKNLKVYLEIQNKKQDKARDFAVIQKEIKELEKKYNEVDSLKEGTRCDRCGSIVSLENLKLLKENIVKEVGAKEEVSDILYKELSKIEEELKQVELKTDELKLKKQSLNEKLTKIDLDIKNLMNEQREYEKKVEKAKSSEIAIQENLKVIEEYNKDLEALKERKERTLKEKEDIVKEYSELKSALEDVDNKIQKFKEGIEKLEFWKEAFSNKGIKSLLLDKFCNQFNILVNSILADVSMGSMSITISSTSQLKSGEERNKIGLEIRIRNAIRRYESLSGGEKRRIDIALCIALNRWVKSFLGILIIDELFAYMDRAGEEAIGGCLFREGQNKAVLVISHTPELGSYTDRIWTMIKENGVSRLLR